MSHQSKPPDTDADPQTRSDPPGFAIDWERYGAYLEDSDLSDAQKREFIATLWEIALGFVDLGFRLHPLQQVENSSQTRGQNDDLRTLVPQTMLDWHDERDDAADRASSQSQSLTTRHTEETHAKA